MIAMLWMTVIATEPVTWEEMTQRVARRQVQVTLANARVMSGRVERATTDALILKGSPDPLPRAAVKTVRYEIRKGNARAKWATGLALAAVGAFLVLGAGETWGENGPASPAAVGVIFAGAGAAAGYGIGHARDRREVVLEIVP